MNGADTEKVKLRVMSNKENGEGVLGRGSAYYEQCNGEDLCTS